MDLSSLIFVALFVAWAVYLVPKALRHHEEDDAARTVDGFSDRMRVLARREPVSATQAELVPSGARPTPPDTAAPTPAPRDDLDDLAPRAARRETPGAGRAAARRAAARRRRVLGVLVLALVSVGGVAVGGVIAPAWVAAPLVLLVAWLVACRLMVRRERAARAAAARRRRTTLADQVIAAEDAALADDRGDRDDRRDDTEEIPAITAEVAADVAGGWTPVPVPLPTYVAKAPAARTVRTIDLDSTGVWSSGRNEADSELAREADAQRAADADVAAEKRRATGS